jgi:hypothetical protein
MPDSAPEPTVSPEPATISSSNLKSNTGKGRKKLFFSLSLVITVCLSAVIFEVGTRILTRMGFTPWGDWAWAEGIRFKLKGSTDGMNSLGFRDRERNFQKTEDTWRILLLGDSFVWGVVDYEKNFPYLLEKSLNALGPDREIELINMGVPGYGPVESLEMWKSMGVKYEPDFVIYGFFYGNDMTDNLPDKHYRAVLGERVLIDHDSPWGRSRFLAILKKRISVHQFKRTHDTEKEMHGITELDLLDPRKYFMGMMHQDQQKYYEHYQGYLEILLKEYHRFADEKGSPLLVLRFPEKIMVDRATREYVANEAGFNLEDISVDRIREKLDSILVNAEVSSIDHVSHGDITPEITRHQAEEELYVETHWNERGNKVAANAMIQPVHDFLTAHGVMFEN